MTVSVCIGSNCHLMGSSKVKNIFQKLIDKYKLQDKVNLEVAFCLGYCKNGVSIKIDNDLITGVTPENAENVFEKKILGFLKNKELI